jgi:hypothetical protein
MRTVRLHLILMLAACSALAAGSSLAAEDSTDVAVALFDGAAKSVLIGSEGSVVAPGAGGGVRVEVSGVGLEIGVELHVGGRDGVRRVSPRYRFCGGDRIALRLTSNRDAHVLLLGQRLDGQPEELLSRNRIVLASGAQQGADGWQPLLPGGGRSRELRRGEVLRVPGQPVVLGDEPGLQRVFVVVSREPFSLRQYFRGREGDHRSTQRPPSLSRLLDLWASNGAQHHAEGGETASYGFQIDASRPAALEIGLRQYPCARRVSMQNRLLAGGGQER